MLGAYACSVLCQLMWKYGSGVSEGQSVNIIGMASLLESLVRHVNFF